MFRNDNHDSRAEKCVKKPLYKRNRNTNQGNIYTCNMYISVYLYILVRF